MKVCICVSGAQRPEEGVGFTGTGVKNGYELPCGFWELDMDPL